MRANRDFERHYGISQTGEILGVGRASIYAKLKAGRLRAIRNSDGRIMVPHSAIAEYLDRATPVFAAQ